MPIMKMQYKPKIAVPSSNCAFLLSTIELWRRLVQVNSILTLSPLSQILIYDVLQVSNGLKWRFYSNFDGEVSKFPKTIIKIGLKVDWTFLRRETQKYRNFASDWAKFKR